MKGNILIVDDAPDIRELLSAVLRDHYQISETDTGAGVRQAFARPQPDVILLDLKLPDADGLELLPVIKKQWPETEVIA
jgi:Response regulator containing CheY-like receiver, AAA-type ATPase, and DNA-binding domains